MKSAHTQAVIFAAVLGSTTAMADITGFENLGSDNPNAWSYNQSDSETPASYPNSNTINITSASDYQNRSVFYNTRQNANQFTASFTYQGNKGSSFHQGMSFVLQNDPMGTESLGDGLWGLGYGGVLNSVAITWNIHSNRIGFSTNGDVSDGEYVDGITLGGNNAIDFTLTYDGTFLTQSLRDTVTGVEFTQNLLVGDISATLGDGLAYVGFGASGNWSSQTISNFSYVVPAPGSVGVLGAGLLVAARRRRA